MAKYSKISVPSLLKLPAGHDTVVPSLLRASLPEQHTVQAAGPQLSWVCSTWGAQASLLFRMCPVLLQAILCRTLGRSLPHFSTGYPVDILKMTYKMKFLIPNFSSKSPQTCNCYLALPSRFRKSHTLSHPTALLG